MKLEHTTNADYPLIGYEYEYLGQPVKVLRVEPEEMLRDSRVVVASRFDQQTDCVAGELGTWQDTTKPLTESQRVRIREAIEDAARNVYSNAEEKLVQWQLKRLESLP